jgi:hypothetical protein
MICYCMGESLKTTEKYVLAQLLVSGSINYVEFVGLNNMLREVRDDALRTLIMDNYTDEILYRHKKIKQ